MSSHSQSSLSKILGFRVWFHELTKNNKALQVQYRSRHCDQDFCFIDFIALALQCHSKYIPLTVFTAAWHYRSLHPGWWWSACPTWHQWRTECHWDPPGSPQGGWAACSGSRRNSHGKGRRRCSCTPGRGCRSRWTEPSRDHEESLVVGQKSKVSLPNETDNDNNQKHENGDHVGENVLV